MPQTKELKPITKKVIWLFAIGQLGWSLMSAILTNFIESFYQPDDVSVKEGMIYFIPQGRVILGIFTIIGGIYAGIFTPTEAAGVSAVYAIIVSLFIYREMNLKQLLQTVAK